MPNPRITNIIAELPFEKKLVGIGSILMVISLFFPWYQDLDTFHTGDIYTGLTGPLYFVGFTFLVLASVSLLVMVMDYLDKKLPLFKVKASKVHFWSGIFSFYLLLVAGTVYFEPDFGVNITLKQSDFGMFAAYCAAALITVGGYMEGRGKAAVREFEKETREELADAVPTLIAKPVGSSSSQSAQQAAHSSIAPQAPATPSAPVRKVVHPLINQRRARDLRYMPQHRVQEQQARPVEKALVKAPASQPIQPVTSVTAAQPVQAAMSTPAAVERAPEPTPPPSDQAEKQPNVQPFRMDL